MQKSRANFKNLVDIITDTNFQPNDLHNTRWDLIDHKLGSKDWEDVEKLPLDAGWEQTPVTIPVPFHQFTAQPGVVDYTVPDFYH